LARPTTYKRNVMQIGQYEIQPISIYLPEWDDRINKSIEYFDSQDLKPYWITGIHAENFGIEASRPYQRDVPDTDWRLEPRTVGGYLSGYMLLNVAWSHPEWKHIMMVEEDCRFIDGWRDKLEQALKDVPEDFDMLYVGSCCTEGRETQKIAGDVYEVKWPLCGHCIIIARKALPILLNGLRNSCIPFDIHLFDEVHPKLKVYTILPRLAFQENTYLPK
jgi:hypothetical protein